MRDLDSLYSRHLEPSVALEMAALFWPDLLERDGFILLADQFDNEDFARVVRDAQPENVEATFNTLYLDTILRAPADEMDGHIWEQIGHILCECWVARAKAAYPERDFIASFHWYSNDSSPGVVLQQRKWARDMS